MNNILILSTKDKKILGIHLKNQLNWSNHVKILKTKTKLRLNIINAISNRAWGANINIIIRTYKSLVLSIIVYGAINEASPNSILNSLNPIHNQGIRLSIGAFRTNPIPNILCKANTPPLHDIRRNMLIHKFALKKLADKENYISSYLFTNSHPL